MQEIKFQKLFQALNASTDNFIDTRDIKKTQYSSESILASAFAIFFTQSESFLNYNRRILEETQHKTNLELVFGVSQIPSDNQVRYFLDNQKAEFLEPVFTECYELAKKTGLLSDYLGLYNKTYIAIDGTQYFCSKKISCEKCLQTHHSNGETSFHHRMLTPVVVNPNMSYVISLMPEFIRNENKEYNKQDCEISAAKRWLLKNKDFLKEENTVILGDDLYSRQPFCKLVVENGLDYIFTCKELSHKSMYSTINAFSKFLTTVTCEMQVKNKKQIGRFEFINNIKMNDNDDALETNFVKVYIEDSKGKKVYSGAFITSLRITKENVSQIVSHARSRWKVENENNNVLKRHGYNLEHNFGHGKENLSDFLATLNIIAFLFHTLLDLKNISYQKAREKNGARYNFFNAFAHALNMITVDSFDVLIDFMAFPKKFNLKVECDTS